MEHSRDYDMVTDLAAEEEDDDDGGGELAVEEPDQVEHVRVGQVLQEESVGGDIEVKGHRSGFIL